MKVKQALNMLGLAMRAGKVTAGEGTVIQDIQKRQAALVIISEEASERTKKTVTNKCHSYDIPYRQFGAKAVLGHSIGKGPRTVLAIKDKNFATKIDQLLDE